MKKGLLRALIIGVSVTATASITAVSLAWFSGAAGTAKDRTINGEVGLRSYFYAGTGTSTDPYEITDPIHYYNLTRLQNLGIFSDKTYFQIGHLFEGDTDPKCIKGFDENNNPIKVDYLDMKSLSYGEKAAPLLPIGNEGTPFVGHFNGNGIPIRNLKISGYPEDIGVFGYVDYNGEVEGLVLDGTVGNGPDGVEGTADDDLGVEICSMGYNADPADFDNELFRQDLDDIFVDNLYNSADYFKDANLSISRYGYNETTGQYEFLEPVSLKHANGGGGTTLDNINDKEEYGEGHETNRTGNIYNKAYLIVNFPEEAADRPFKYSWVASSSLVQEKYVLDIDGDTHADKAIVIDMTSLANSPNFSSGDDMQVDTRISIMATCEVGGYKFSRVIQSYLLEFRSNGDKYENTETVTDCKGNVSCNIYCDYTHSPEGASTPDIVTNYHHGNNIGFLVGHLNGSLSDSYVYNGRFTFNQTGYTPILTESDSGLVGELGKNVINSIDPEIGITVNGNIGIMNFTKIYKMIRKDMVADKTYTLACGKQTPTGSNDPVSYISYDPFINEDTFDNFSEYLRQDAVTGNRHYIIQTNEDMKQKDTYTISNTSDIKSDFNKVDFLWNKVIQDEDDVDRGLGVFKIITSHVDGHPEDAYGSYFLNGIGDSQIVNGVAKTEVFFSTAEYDHTAANHGVNWDNSTPLNGVHLPTYNEITSFEYPFSRDYNYRFKLNLADMAKAGKNNYMYNTTSTFLQNYLSSILINGHGKPVNPGSPRFGFMFAREKDGQVERPTSLSSYMPVKTPDFTKKYDSMGTGEYYPANCIAFSIKNEFGGNVSVVGNGADITIYSIDKTTSSKNNEIDKALYSMRSSTISGDDRHRYFDYDVQYGVTGLEAEINNDMGGSDSTLYGHIFKLPKGDYVIGARGGTAKVYFLAVQGQDDGELGDTEFADVGYKVDRVEFLNERPTYDNFKLYDPESEDEEKKNALKVSGVTFSANFNDNTIRSFYATTKDYESSPVLWLDFDDGADPFVTYLLTYSEDKRPFYIQNVSNPYIETSVAYRSS